MLGRTFEFEQSNRIELFCSRMLDVDLDLYYCGMENCITHFKCGPSVRYNYLVHYIVKGRGFYECNNTRYEVKQGDIFTIFPGDFTYYATYPEDPWSFCWFGFNGKKAVDLLQVCGITKGTPVRHLLEKFALDGLVEECVKAILKNGEPVKTQLQGYLYLIFSKMQESYEKTESSKAKKTGFAEHVEKALLYIDYNFFLPLSVQNLADYVGLERTYFSKIFSLTTGMSPQEYMIHYRMEKAVHLMKTTSLSFKQIGTSVGIPNEYYFSRLFKKIKGVPPKKYRGTPD